MINIIAIILATLVPWAHAKSADKWDEKLSERAIKAWLLKHADLDDTTLGKPSNLGISGSSGPLRTLPARRAHLLAQRPIGGSRSVAAFQTRATRHDGDVWLEPATVQPFNRRQASLATALAGFVAAGVVPFPARADEGFAPGPETIKFRDDIVGSEKDEGVLGGDTVTVNYVLKFADTGAVIEEKKNFKFVANAGQVIPGFDLALVGDAGRTMARLKVGGKRTVLIPSFLGYGSRGRSCKVVAGGKICEVPPKSNLELTIELLKDQKDERVEKEERA